jgi:hypothetical protein
MTSRLRALEIILDARATHVEAIRYLEELHENFGSVDFHRQCIADYDEVLAYLNSEYAGQSTNTGCNC